MAQLFAILHSLDNPNSPQSDLHLPLSLQAPNKDQLDLSKCPHVYENGRYDMTIRLDLNDLEQELNRAAQLASEDKAKLQESSNSLLLGEQDKKRARLQMNKISDYIDLDSEEAEDEAAEDYADQVKEKAGEGGEAVKEKVNSGVATAASAVSAAAQKVSAKADEVEESAKAKMGRD